MSLMAPAFKMMDATNLSFVEAMLATHIESEETQVRLVSVQVNITRCNQIIIFLKQFLQTMVLVEKYHIYSHTNIKEMIVLNRLIL